MIFFALSIFISAFLLFQVQPMIGKFILPWFGGTPAVWSTVILFFQVMLTGGYAYAYWVIGHVRPARQIALHLTLLGITLALLLGLGLVWPSPVTPSADWKTTNVDFPVVYIFWLLTVSVGLPYFMLASNGPLMQAWFSRIFPERSYTRLYALSNAGSLLGLLAYPIFIEPSLSLKWQGWAWAGGFVLFALLAGWVALRTKGTTGPTSNALESSKIENPSGPVLVLWIVLSATASLFLLSVTNQISQEVAVIPFLWILPLTVYLLSFILTFSDARWYDRRLYALGFILAGVAALWVLTNAETLNVMTQLAVYTVLLFLGCMICHGELYRLRPSAEHLTIFYLMVSVGGAVGGIFVNLVAPFVFTGYWEFYLAWLLTIAILITVLLPRVTAHPRVWGGTLLAAFALALPGMAWGLNRYSDALFVSRNFYGVLRVREQRTESGKDSYIMIHGITIHGIQYMLPEYRREPTTYFVEDGGGGLALLNHPRRGEGMRVGVLGLGAGTLAAYSQPGDQYRFYEINPVVIDLAWGQGGYFSFLQDSPADVSVILGDARISLEEELKRNPDGQNFDVLILDTFSSDSIPVHLVTREALALYLEHLAPDGILAAHISNRHLNLQPVLWQLAREFDLSIVRVDRPARPGEDAFPSEWILLARDPALLNAPGIRAHSMSLDGFSTSIRLWTDDYSNLFQILK